MAQLTVKALNNQYFIQSKGLNFEMLLQELDLRFKTGSAQRWFNAFFSFDFELSEDQWVFFFNFLYEHQILYLGSGHLVETVERGIRRIISSIHSGEFIEIDEPTLILGDVGDDVSIKAYADLYVLGEMAGCIDMVYRELKLVSSSLNDAKIRIFDSNFQNLTSFTTSKVYYMNHRIVLSKEEF